MGISSVSAQVSAIGQSSSLDVVQLTVLKKAIDIKAQGVLQLIQAASNIIPSGPSHLGNSIDTVA
jgi:hypothetical protein